MTAIVIITLKHSKQFGSVFILFYLLKIPHLPTANFNRIYYTDISKPISNGYKKTTKIEDLNYWFLFIQIGNQLFFKQSKGRNIYEV